MSHKARYVSKDVKCGSIVSWNRKLYVVITFQQSIFNDSSLGILSIADNDRSKPVIVKASEVQPTDYHFIDDPDGWRFIKPSDSEFYRYTNGLPLFDGWRDVYFVVRKIDPIRRMVLLAPSCRYSVSAWVYYSEFVHCFKSVKE